MGFLSHQDDLIDCVSADNQRCSLQQQKCSSRRVSKTFREAFLVEMILVEMIAVGLCRCRGYYQRAGKATC